MRFFEPLAMRSTTVIGSPASGRDIDCRRPPVSPTRAARTSALVPRDARPNVDTTPPGHAGVLPAWAANPDNSWGLGPEIRDHKSPHWTGALNSAETYGHFGRSGTFLWWDPVRGGG
jgi:CubicO group peptidase (beta-lactamase class C family)